MLELSNVSVRYDAAPVLHGISLRVGEGELVALIGANGAGKTTMLRTISGLLHPLEGEVSFAGTRVDRASPTQLVQKGVIHVPEGRRIFPGLTVLENLEVGACGWRRSARETMEAELDRVYALFPKLRERQRQLGWSLSGGEQQMLALGRALMGRPRLLLLDEPSLGLAPVLVEEVFRTIGEINAKSGTSMLLVEQNAYMALTLANRGYVIENGRIVLTDASDALLKNDGVRRAYLGG